MDRAESRVSSIVTGRSLGLVVCLNCRLTVRGARTPHSHCPRCHARLHERKPFSLAVTTVLLIGAAVLYVPANILPVMDTRTFYDNESDTIMSGVLVLLHSGSWPIAALVFIASIVVPALKILALGVLLYSAWRRSKRGRLQRIQQFRWVEFIDSWLMLDS
jgi:paraquat-inducible protein A